MGEAKKKVKKGEAKKASKKTGSKKVVEMVNKIDFRDSKILIVALVAVLVIVLVVYLVTNTDYHLINVEDTDEPAAVPQADVISQGAFDYINEYRASEEMAAFEFDFDVYLVALNMSNQKERNPLMFRQVPERNEFVENAIDLSDFPIQYTAIYSIGRLGIDGFRNEFDRIYFVKNIIKLDKYDTGAIGCTSNYCSLILLNDEGGFEATQEF